jgi:hypothetical protein
VPTNGTSEPPSANGLGNPPIAPQAEIPESLPAAIHEIAVRSFSRENHQPGRENQVLQIAMLNQVMENGGAGIAETTEKAYSSFVAGVLAGLTHRRADGAPPAPDGSSNHAADSQHPVQLAAELIALAGELMAPHQRIQQPEAALVTTSLPTIESILCAKKAQPSPPSSSAVFARDAASMRIQMALQSTIAAAAVEGAGATHAPFATPPQPPSSAGAPGAQAGPPPPQAEALGGQPVQPTFGHPAPRSGAGAGVHHRVSIL